MMRNALVLAGGGVAGIAWETGVLVGLGEVDSDLIEQLRAGTTTLIGTSAGSTVAAQLATGTSLEDLFAAQLADETSEMHVEIDMQKFAAMLAGVTMEPDSPEARRRRIGAIALAADTPSVEARRAVIAARIPNAAWTEHRLLITAVDTATGELRVFDRTSGVDLVDAVAASCAVPGIWPTVSIDGHQYMDGGMRSGANADLAAGSERVLILVPSAEESPFGRAIPDTELEALASSRVFIVYADPESISAMGANPLDPASRRPAAIAGRAVGRRIAAEVGRFWREG